MSIGDHLLVSLVSRVPVLCCYRLVHLPDAFGPRNSFASGVKARAHCVSLLSHLQHRDTPVASEVEPTRLDSASFRKTCCPSATKHQKYEEKRLKTGACWLVTLI